MSESDILGPNAYFSDIENLVSLERAKFKDYNFKYRTKIFLLFMSISPLWSKCLDHINGVHVKYNGDTFLSIHLGFISWGNFAKIWYFYITCKEFCHWKAFYSFCGTMKIQLTITIWCIILTSFYLVMSFEHLDQNSHVGSHSIICHEKPKLLAYAWKLSPMCILFVFK